MKFLAHEQHSTPVVLGISSGVNLMLAAVYAAAGHPLCAIPAAIAALLLFGGLVNWLIHAVATDIARAYDTEEARRG